MTKWKPKVELTRLTPKQISRLSNSWRFLDSLNIHDTIEFRCEILAQRPIDQKFLVRWHPTGILDDAWVNKASLPSNGIHKNQAQNLNWGQKLLIRDKLITKS